VLQGKTDLSRGKQKNLIYSSLVAIVLLIGIWLFISSRDDNSFSKKNSINNNAITSNTNGNSQYQAVLFFISENGTSLVSKKYDVPFNENRLVLARNITEAQLSEPPEPLLSPFPEGTRLRTIYLTSGGNIFVDLNQAVSSGHPGGSLDELFTVYALVNALTTNVPDVLGVQILIEGQEVDTLAGHVDLRRPLELNMQWVSQSNTDFEESRNLSGEG